MKAFALAVVAACSVASSGCGMALLKNAGKDEIAVPGGFVIDVAIATVPTLGVCEGLANDDVCSTKLEVGLIITTLAIALAVDALYIIDPAW